MLYKLIASSGAGDTILRWIETGALAIEILVMVIILVTVFYSFGRYLVRAALRPGAGDWHEQLKLSLGRSLLLSLEMLVAADIVHTVALEVTLESIVALGLLVLIRTFLSWALVVEIEGRWPWQARPEHRPATIDAG